MDRISAKLSELIKRLDELDLIIYITKKLIGGTCKHVFLIYMYQNLMIFFTLTYVSGATGLFNTMAVNDSFSV